MRGAWAILGALVLAGCFAPPFPDAPAVGAGHGGAGGADDHHGAAAAAAMGIGMVGACFEVEVPGDVEPSWIHGTLFSPGLSADAPVVVLIPGGASHAHVFDGEHFGYGRDNATTLPRALARHGYAALIVDRLGMGLSPYAGHGARLTGEVQDAHVATLLARLREGSFTTDPDPEALCPGARGEAAPIARVVLAGQSLGGSLVMRHLVGGGEPADGYLVFGMTNQPLGERPSQGPAQGIRGTAECLPTQADRTVLTGYYETLCPGPDGLAIGCFDLWMWPPGADLAVLEAFCANDQIHAEPAGSITMFNQGAAEAVKARIPSAAPVPIHFVFGEHDCITNDGDACDDPAKTRAELAEWQRACPCDATATWIPRVGHVFQFHSGYPLVNDDVLAWLRASGLGP